MKKYLVISLVVVSAFLGVLDIASAAATTWDFSNLVLQPLQSQWAAQIKGAYFTSTSTSNHSTFPYASSTAFASSVICLTGDLPCRSTWPSVGGGTFPFTPTPYGGAAYVFSATSTGLRLTGTPISLSASSTAVFDQINVGSTTSGTMATSTFFGHVNVTGNVFSNGVPIATPSTFVYINSNRTDSYTSDGTEPRPYKSYTTANAAVISRGLTSAVYIVAPGTYSEQTMTLPSIPLVIYGNGATVIMLSGASLGAGTMTIPSDIDYYNPVVFGAIALTATSLTNPHALHNCFVAGNVSFAGNGTMDGCAVVDQDTAAFPFLSQSASSTVTGGSGSLVAITESNIQAVINNHGTMNLDVLNVQVSTSTRYAIMSTSTGSVLRINGMSLQNEGTGGGINLTNGATTNSPNQVSAAQITLGAGSTRAISCGSATTFIGTYSAFTRAGARLTVDDTCTDKLYPNMEGINVDTRVGIASSTPGVPLAVTGAGVFTGTVTAPIFFATSTLFASTFPYASTTAITATTASTTNLIVSGLNAANCDVKSSTTGVLSCGVDATGAGGSGSDPFTHPTGYSATSSALYPSGLQAGTSTIGTLTSTSTTLLATNSGSVGIATTSPYGLLSVNAPGGTAPYFVIGSSSSEVLRVTANASPVFAIGTTTPWGQFSLNPNGIGTGPEFVVGSSTKTDFVITNAGRVGVASTTPGATFSVQGSGLVSGTLTTANLTVTSAVGSAGCATFSTAGVVSNTGVACGTGAGGSFPFTPTTAWTSAANSTSTLTIFTQGIGATASSTIGNGTQAGGLTISGGATTTGNAYFGSNVGIATTSPYGLLSVHAPGGTAPYFVIGSSSSEVLRVSANATPRFAIGSTSPWGQMSLNPNGIGAGPEFVIGSSTKTDFVVTNAGNVGVATSAPGTLFSIGGSANFNSNSTSTIYNGLVLSGGTLSIPGWTGTNCVRAINGVLSMAASDCGSSTGLTAYDAWTHPAATQSATTSTMIFTTGGLVINAASSTIQGNLLINGNSTTTNATTTNLAITGITSSLLFANSTGSIIATTTLATNFGGTGSTTLGGILTGNGTGPLTSATVSSPLVFSGNSLSITQSSFANNGYLSSTDWQLFNNKVSSSSLPAFPFDRGNTYGTTSFATTTPLWIKTAIYASSTASVPSVIDNMVFTNATGASEVIGSSTISKSTTGNGTFGTLTATSSFKITTLSQVPLYVDSTGAVQSGGSGTSGNCVKWGTNNLLADQGSSCGGGTPGGSFSQLQFNNSGSFGGVALSNWGNLGNFNALGTTTASSTVLTIGTSTAPQLALSDNTPGDNLWTFRAASNYLYIATSTSGMAPATSSVPAITIDKNGLVGISSTSPSASFAVQGNYFQTTPVNLVNAFTIANQSNNTVFNIDTTATGDMFDVSTTTANGSPVVFDITNVGGVGVGSTTPFAQLSLHSTTANIFSTLFAVASSTNSATSTLYAIDSVGHTTYGGAAGSISSCGTSPVITGNDSAMYLKIGSGAVNACTVTFNYPWKIAPLCFAQLNINGATTTVITASTTATTLLLTGSATNMGGANMSLFCTGYRNANTQ